jgi:hypothetical protein
MLHATLIAFGVETFEYVGYGHREFLAVKMKPVYA